MTPFEFTAQARRLLEAKQYSQVIRLCEEMIRLRPSSPMPYNTLGLCMLAMGNATRARQALEKAISLGASSASVFQNLGRALQLEERRVQAVDAFQEAIRRGPNESAGYLSLGSLLLGHARVAEAIECLEEGHRRIPDSPTILVQLARAFDEDREAAKAESALRRASQLDSSANGALGLWLQSQGRFEESYACFELSIKANPVQGYGYYGLLSGKRLAEIEPNIVQQMLDASEDPRLVPMEVMYLQYALGKAYDQKKQYGDAMQAYDKANALAYAMHNKARPFDIDQLRRMDDGWMKPFTNESLRASIKSPTDETEMQTPILIVGMIRSGTTLAEQILSSHSMIGAAGELRFWIEAASRLASGLAKTFDAGAAFALREPYLRELATAAPDKRLVTDKMPLNYMHLGLIHLAFPNAKIIHIKRNAVDTCLSIYMTYFGGGPHYAYNRDNIVSFYKEYLRVMAYWRSVMPPENLLEVTYEDLVFKPEETIPEMVRFCGVPWEDSCLHHENNPAPVATPSLWQARQPLYTTSTERWKKYESWLGAFAELIGA